MAKGQTNIIGLTPEFRPGKKSDSFRVGVLPPGGKYFFTSAKIDPKLKAINQYLKSKKLHKDEALKDPVPAKVTV